MQDKGPHSKSLVHDSLTPISPKIDILKDMVSSQSVISAMYPFNTVKLQKDLPC